MCGSSDALAIYDDNENCFSCGYHKTYKTGDNVVTQLKPKPEGVEPIAPLPSKSMPAIKERGLSTSTVQRYKVSVNTNPDSTVEAIFPRFHPETGEHICNQIRYVEKDFSVEGDNRAAGLFGQSEFPAGGKSVTITEGYYDAMAAFQMTGSRFPNVAVMSASSAKKEVVNAFEYLNSFEEIVINFDNDDPGQTAAKAVAQLFDPGKVRILDLKLFKDANDYLLNNRDKDYINEWFRAPKYKPDGLVMGTEMWETILNHKEPKSVPYPWEGLNEKTYGMRESEVTLILADTGVGKTTVCKELEYQLLMDENLIASGDGVGFLHFEEPKYDTAIGLMSIHNNKPYHLPDTERTEAELKEAYDAVVNTNRVVIWDHFGSNDVDVVLAKIRHMAAMGCKYVVVDHLSIIVSDHSGDERKQLDEISTKLKTLIMNLGIHAVCVIHINRQGQARGSAGPEQIANTVIRLERDKKTADDWRRNVTEITVEKCRLTGRTGPACLLFYNDRIHRLEEIKERELIERYWAGESIAGAEFAAYDEGM